MELLLVGSRSSRSKVHRAQNRSRTSPASSCWRRLQNHLAGCCCESCYFEANPAGTPNPNAKPVCSVPARPGPARLAPPLGCGNLVLMVPLVKLVKLLWSPGAGAQQDSLFHLLWRGQSSWWSPPPPPSGLHQEFWTRPPPAPLGFTTPPPGLQHRHRPWLCVLRLRTRSAQVHVQTQDPGLGLAPTPTPTPSRCLQGDVSGLLLLLLECALVLIG